MTGKPKRLKLKHGIWLMAFIAGLAACRLYWEYWLCFVHQPGYLITAIQMDDLNGVRRHLNLGLSLSKRNIPDSGFGSAFDEWDAKPSICAASELPLTEAAAMGKPELVKLFLARGAPVNQRTAHGYTALHYACLSGYSLEVLYALLKSKADVNAVGGPWATPLDLVPMDQTECIRGLLKNGARVCLGRITRTDVRAAQKLGTQMKPAPKPKDWSDGSRNRPADYQTTLDQLLCKAASARAERTVAMLLELGANPNAVDRETKMTALLLVGFEEDPNRVVRPGAVGTKCLKLLLAHGARIDKAVDSTGTTILHLACMAHNYAAVKLLLEAGADPNAKTKDGLTPYACLPLVEDLLR